MEQRLKEIVNNSHNIIFFGGAGVSTESGIPDFRGTDGLYFQKYKHPPEEILSHDYFINHTEGFFNFYKEKMLYLDAVPNKAHYALAKLEEEGKLKAVITQNIDGLHHMAGSQKVLELHGSVHRNYCMKCHKSYGVGEIVKSNRIPICSCSGIIKPDVVLYGESLNSDILMSAAEYISNADILIIGGTSLGVYPAAGLINYFRGRYLILINKTKTPMDDMADVIFRESIADVLGENRRQIL